MKSQITVITDRFGRFAPTRLSSEADQLWAFLCASNFAGRCGSCEGSRQACWARSLCWASPGSGPAQRFCSSGSRRCSGRRCEGC
eukprot:scaffold6838_cov124-Pinguiococcus_pyrenoidosus.AAC.1